MVKKSPSAPADPVPIDAFLDADLGGDSDDEAEAIPIEDEAEALEALLDAEDEASEAGEAAPEPEPLADAPALSDASSDALASDSE